MRVVLQRVKEANVSVDDSVVSEIGTGYLLLVGIGQDDTEQTAEKVANKILGLRINEDENGKMNLELAAQTQSILAISQFTLYANIKKGKRPSFTDSMEPERAEELYTYFCKYCRNQGYDVKEGIFAADMKVALINDGPVTIIIDSNDLV